MLSKALLRLGASAARHPWRVIAAWLIAATLAVLAAVAIGGRTADSMTAPGLDSRRAAELIERAGTGQEGMTAQVVVTPLDDGATFFDDGARFLHRHVLEVDDLALAHVGLVVGHVASGAQQR